MFLKDGFLSLRFFLWEERSEKRRSRKSSKTLYPYLNRHWCAGRTDSGVERPMVKELGKFTPYVRKKEGSSLTGVAEKCGRGLVIKTTGLCKVERRRIGTDVCPMPVVVQDRCLPEIENRANGCCITDSTKVHQSCLKTDHSMRERIFTRRTPTTL